MVLTGNKRQPRQRSPEHVFAHTGTIAPDLATQLNHILNTKNPGRVSWPGYGDSVGIYSVILSRVKRKSFKPFLSRGPTPFRGVRSAPRIAHHQQRYTLFQIPSSLSFYDCHICNKTASPISYMMIKYYQLIGKKVPWSLVNSVGTRDQTF